MNQKSQPPTWGTLLRMLKELATRDSRIDDKLHDLFEVAGENREFQAEDVPPEEWAAIETDLLKLLREMETIVVDHLLPAAKSCQHIAVRASRSK